MRETITPELLRCIPEIDFNLGYRYFLGNIENYSKALMSMLKSIKAKLPILKTMNATEEYEGLRIITQTLRKMLTNIGATEASEASYQLETALLNDNKEVLCAQLTEYIYMLMELSEHLELFIKKLNVTNNLADQQETSSFFNKDFTRTKERIRISEDFIQKKII